MENRPALPSSVTKLSSARRLAVAVLGTLALLGAVTVTADGALAASDTVPPTKPAPRP